MKKLVSYLLTIFSVSGALDAGAQTEEHKWGIGIGGGVTRLNDDFKNNYFNTRHQKEFGKFFLMRYVNTNVDVIFTFLGGDVKTFNTIPGIKRIVTSTLRSGDISFDYKFFSESKKMIPYLSGGVGLLFADNFLARNQYVVTAPVGFGIKLLPFERVNIDLNVRQYATLSDKLDGTAGGSNNDNFLTISAGIIFNVGKAEDTDGDGVIDNADQCPGTKNGARVDKKGCPADNDGDGVDNDADKCPQMVGLAKFMGCPDGDGDGVEDLLDKCPNVPGSPIFYGCPDNDGDGIEDAKDDCPQAAGLAKFNGCPDKDNDGMEDSKDKCPDVAGIVAFEGCADTDKDGIADHKDRCPNIAGTVKMGGCPDSDGDEIADSDDRCPDKAGVPDFGGCPPPNKSDIKKLQTIAKKINFETGKTKLLPESFLVLDQVVALMKANAFYKLSIEGHTDNMGNSKINLELSKGRADAVKNYLIISGIDAENVVSAGFGDTKPFGSNATAKGRDNNRRCELKLF